MAEKSMTEKIKELREQIRTGKTDEKQKKVLFLLVDRLEEEYKGK